MSFSVPCSAAARWSQSPSTLMQSPGMGSTAHVPVCMCKWADAEPSMHQTSLHETAQRPPSPWPVPITLRASVPASTVQCRWERSQQMLATSVHGSQSMADRVLGMCSAQTSPVPLCRGCAGQLCSNNPVGCGQNSVAVTNK
jgi:hypothetical protein